MSPSSALRTRTRATFLVLAGMLIGSFALIAVLRTPWVKTFGWSLERAGGRDQATPWVADFETPLAPLPALEQALRAAATPTAASTAGPSTAPEDLVRSHARGVVLFVGDGMGASQLMAGRIVSAGVNGRLAIEQMPVATWVSTHAATSLYTDSAAAATAMATGEKTAPGLLALRPDGTPIRTLFEAARDAGIATASVTDTYVLDATPAAFLAHELRRDYDPIAASAAQSGISVLAGTVVGSRPGGSDDDTFSRDLRSRGTTIVRDADAWRIALAEPAPIAGFFPAESIADPRTEPSLQSLAVDIFDRLHASPEGFLMLVESEEADTGGHANDFSRVAQGVAALDRAVRSLLERAAEAGDVLIIVTADHETGGLGLINGHGDEPLRIRWATGGHTAEPVPLFAFGPGADRLGRVRDNTEIADAIASALGLTDPAG